MFAGWIAHLLLARNQPINWAEALVVGLAGSFVGRLLISLVSGDGVALRPSGILRSLPGGVVAGCASASGAAAGGRYGRAASSARSSVRWCCWRPGRPSEEAPAAGRGNQAPIPNPGRRPRWSSSKRGPLRQRQGTVVDQVDEDQLDDTAAVRRVRRRTPPSCGASRGELISSVWGDASTTRGRRG